MSVHPVAFNVAAGTVDLVNDETGHGGSVPLSAIDWIAGPDGNRAPDFMVARCPDGCGALSIHPVSGGANAAQVQELFVRQARRAGCPCGQLPAGRPFVTVIAHIKTHVTRQDGPGRWATGPIS